MKANIWRFAATGATYLALGDGDLHVAEGAPAENGTPVRFYLGLESGLQHAMPVADFEDGRLERVGDDVAIVQSLGELLLRIAEEHSVVPVISQSPLRAGGYELVFSLQPMEP
jgi:hypothetical protein